MLWKRNIPHFYNYLQFKDGETEAQRGYLICLRPQNPKREFPTSTHGSCLLLGGSDCPFSRKTELAQQCHEERKGPQSASEYSNEFWNH